MRTIFAAIIFLSVSTVANAVPVTWTVNATYSTVCNGAGCFPNNGVVTGYFVYDADLDPATNRDQLNASHDYSFSLGFPGPILEVSPIGISHIGWFTDDAYSEMELEFATGLTNSGGVIDIVAYRDEPYEGPGEAGRGSFVSITTGNGGGVSMYFDGGTVSAVPIPATVWLFGPALAGLSWLRRKRSACL